MNRRQLLRAGALGSLAAVAGCVNLTARGGGDADSDATNTPLHLANHDLPTCSEADGVVYEVSNPRLETQPDRDQVMVTFTVDYVGPDEDQYSVAPTVTVVFYDDQGNRVGRRNQAETFSPTDTETLSYSFGGEGEWQSVDAFGIDVVDAGESGESGCLAVTGS